MLLLSAQRTCYAPHYAPVPYHRRLPLPAPRSLARPASMLSRVLRSRALGAVVVPRVRLVRQTAPAVVAVSRRYSHAPADEPKFLECFEQFFSKAASLANLPPHVVEGLKSCQVRGGDRWRVARSKTAR